MKKLSRQPDPWMRWIYDPKFQDDPKARYLRERRARAIQNAPYWMIEMARLNDEKERT